MPSEVRRSAHAGGGAQVELRGLTKRYGDSVAVDHVDLSIAPGEFVTMLGPSGSGKTTVLNILAGFVEPDEGSVLVDGVALDGVPAFRRNFGVVFQSYALFPHMSVQANVAFPLRMRGTGAAEAESAADRVLSLVGLSEHAAKRPGQLSGGQQQRVALARAIVYEPRLILMDEPLSALDRNLREALKLELKELHAKIGATIIYVTHDQGEALTMSDRIAMLRNGKLQAFDEPLTLYKHPPNLFAATFLGESNCLSGTIVRSPAAGRVLVRTEHGWEVDAAAAAEFAPGTEVILTLRPEHIRVVRREEALVAGRVERVAFLGEIVSLRVVLAKGGMLQVRALNLGDLALTAPGNPLFLAWDPDAIRALPPEAVR